MYFNVVNVQCFITLLRVIMHIRGHFRKCSQAGGVKSPCNSIAAMYTRVIVGQHTRVYMLLQSFELYTEACFEWILIEFCLSCCILLSKTYPTVWICNSMYVCLWCAHVFGYVHSLEGDCEYICVPLFTTMRSSIYIEKKNTSVKIWWFPCVIIGANKLLIFYALIRILSNISSKMQMSLSVCHAIYTKKKFFHPTSTMRALSIVLQAYKSYFYVIWTMLNTILTFSSHNVLAKVYVNNRQLTASDYFNLVITQNDLRWV